MKTSNVGSVCAPDNDGHLYWECLYTPFVELRSSPEFAFFITQDRTKCPRCLLWHGVVTCINCTLDWILVGSRGRCRTLENPWALTVCNDSPWNPMCDDEDEDGQDMAEAVPHQPNIWSDGSREPIPHLDIDVAAAGFFSRFPAFVYDDLRW